MHACIVCRAMLPAKRMAAIERRGCDARRIWSITPVPGTDGLPLLWLPGLIQA